MNEEWVNPMYPFLDTTENLKYIPEYVPTSAMYYDGLLFEGVIEGYQTLSVEGREMISVDIESQQVQIGSLITNQTLPSRILKVKYKLSDRNPEKLQQKFNELKRYLYRTSDVPIQFNDELDYTYYGRFSNAETPNGATNDLVSSYEIFCADPRKYSKKYISFGEISTYTPYETVPDIVRCTLSAGVGVTVKNGNKQLKVITSKLKKGDVVEFRPREGDLLINGEDATIYLSWADSNLEDFTIKKGDRITTDNGKIEIIYRTVML